MFVHVLKGHQPGQDSNLEREYQKLLCCLLHHRVITHRLRQRSRRTGRAGNRCPWRINQKSQKANKALFVFRIAAAVCPRNLNWLPRPLASPLPEHETRSPRRSIRTENYPSDEKLYRCPGRVSMELQKIFAVIAYKPAGPVRLRFACRKRDLGDGLSWARRAQWRSGAAWVYIWTSNGWFAGL